MIWKLASASVAIIDVTSEDQISLLNAVGFGLGLEYVVTAQDVETSTDFFL